MMVLAAMKIAASADVDEYPKLSNIRQTAETK